MNYFFTGLIFIFLAGILPFLFKESSKSKIFSFFVFWGMIFLLSSSLRVIFSGMTMQKMFLLSEPIGKIPFVIDPLAAFFIFIIGFMGFVVSLYLPGYILPYLNKNKNVSYHFLMLSFLICSMLGVVTVQNALFFLIMWEIMSLSSFFLVLFEDQKKTLSAGINYLIYMHISAIFITLGFVLLHIKSGCLDFNSFKLFLMHNQLFSDIVLVLFFIGFGIKSGFVPFHNWLPKAHPAAPSHVSALMSGVMIKTGIYGILRILTLIYLPSKIIAYLVLIVSVFTALFGILYSIAQNNIKKLLAYSSIENIGIIGIGIGVGMLGLVYENNLVAMLGFVGCIFHILNHSIFKELLFLGAGAVYQKTHIKDIEKMGGLIKKMPMTAAMFLLGAIAIVGLPPFNGFVGKFLIYLGLLKGLEIKSIYIFVIFVLSIASLAMVGMIAMLGFSKVFSIVFLGMPRSKYAENVDSDVDKTMIFSMMILAFLILFIGLFPQFMVSFILNPVKVLLPSVVNSDISGILSIMQIISFVGFVFVSAVIVILVLKYFIFKSKISSVKNTWGCGYEKINSRMQYTASSYVGPFLAMLKPLFIKKFDVKKPKELFPKEAHFKLDFQDIEEFYIVNPLIEADEKFLAKFQWIQGGDTQHYILYGLIFLILALLGVFVGVGG